MLVLIKNATSAAPTYTKDLIGAASAARYDFPNLVFDSLGRAVTTYSSNDVAYAQSP